MTGALPEELRKLAETRAAQLLRAAEDPDFPQKRDRIVRLIGDRIEAILAPAGFTRKGNLWKRRGWWFNLSIELQRSRLGHDAWVNLAATPRLAIGTGRRPVAQRLGWFYPSGYPATEPGRMTYQVLIENPAELDEPMQVLREKALPWLLAMGRPFPGSGPKS
ncbi:hypothetical protein [Paracoccus pacificus]|uniref:DUF4304 domain-containing protein n=1 Tax=Paracoccus pacificus TaxID=1463598 RepID=A0ABW4R3E4_9RHOB